MRVSPRVDVLRVTSPHEFSHSFIDVVLPQVGEHRSHPGIEEGAGDAQSDSARSTCYESHSFLQVFHRHFPRKAPQSKLNPT